MSIELISLAKNFIESKIIVDNFVEQYMEKWKKERDSGISKKDTDEMSECCSSIFVLADCYNPEPDRRESEVDEEGLKKEIKSTLKKFNAI